MEVRNHSIDNINYDLKLMKLLSNKHPASYQGPKNIRDLGLVLKHRNNTQKYSQDVINKGKEWLNNQGINVEALLNEISKPVQTTTDKEAPPKHIDNYYYIELSQQNIPQYIQKAYQNASMSLVHYAVSQQQPRAAFKAFLRNHKQDMSRFNIGWECQSNPQRKEIYLRLIKQTVSKDKNPLFVRKQLLQQLKTSLWDAKGDHFWHILATQLQTYQPQKNFDQNMTKIMIASLGLVQQNFARRLHGHQINHYLSTNYLNRLQGRYMGEKGAIWAKTWIYMCAGMHKQALQLMGLNYKHYVEIINAYSSAEASIRQGKPTKFLCRARTDIQDVFYDQIIFSLNGQGKCSCEVMSETYSLELIWVLLRTTGIFWATEQNEFLKIRKGVTEKYLECNYNSQLIKNMFYLADYANLIKMGPNSLLNKDDYMHFLIVLSAYSPLTSQTDFQQTLIQKLIDYILELFLQQKQEYIYYVSLLPSARIPSQVSSIIVSSDALQTFNWTTLSTLIDTQTYRLLAEQTIAKHVVKKGDYLGGANKTKELLMDVDQALSYLVTMLVRYYNQLEQFSQQDIIKAEQLGIELSTQIDANPIFASLFDLFVKLRELMGLVRKRNPQTLRTFLSLSKFIILDTQAHFVILDMLEKLCEFNGIGVYFIYLRSAVKAAEIYMTQLRRTEELNMFKETLLSSCQRLLQSERLNYSSSQHQVISLLDYLRASL